MKKRNILYRDPKEGADAEETVNTEAVSNDTAAEAGAGDLVD